MDESHRIKIRDLNPHIVCSLCAGYFIDATTVSECLHTFCKSCIVKYLQSSNSCPQCNIKIHETQPLMNLKPDRTMQDIVLKIVPGLFEGEEKRRQEFYKSRGLLRLHKQDENILPTLSSIYDNPRGHYYRNDEQVCMCLEREPYSRNNEEPFTVSLPRKFVRCSMRMGVIHVKQLLRKKLAIPNDLDVDIVCKGKLLSKDLIMKQVWLMYWSEKTSPMMLFYNTRPRQDFKEELSMLS